MAANSVSVLICTRNRAGELRKTLAALRSVSVPQGANVEIVVGDNGSTDDTRAVVESATSGAPPIRYVAVPRPGKGYVYNALIAASQGDVLLFTDDDVRVPPNWVEGMCGPIWRGEADAVAGGVRLAPDLRRPWMTLLHRSMMAETERLDPRAPSEVVGANMAFTRRVLDKVPAFDPELGPGALGFGDETLFAFQLREAGFRLIGALDVEVEHHPNASRLSRQSFLASAAAMGRVWGYLSYNWLHEPIGRKPVHLCKRSVKLLLLRLWRRPGRNAEGVPEWELQLVHDVWANRYFLSQVLRRRPRKYEYRGLVKQHASMGG